jgi:polyferredoxin
MRIVVVRRISQTFFLMLFLWFCVVTAVGQEWWQLRGWPVNWFLQLDPLVAFGTLLTTGTLYAGLAWALVTVVLTVLLGRFFCGWVCPFGSLHHLVGYLARRGKPFARVVEQDQYHPGQSIKYYLLALLLAAASGSLLGKLLQGVLGSPAVAGILAGGSVLAASVGLFKGFGLTRRQTGALLLLSGVFTLSACILAVGPMVAASLQTGLLDPLPLLHRSFHLVLVPLLDGAGRRLSESQRYYQGAWFVGFIFLSAVLLNLKRPRFYCRFVCPLGALFGILSRFALWRVGKREDVCTQCKFCSAGCEGACQPAEQIRHSECILCMNCLENCRHGLMTYRTERSASGEVLLPDLSRRGVLITLASGVAAVPLLRLGGTVGPAWKPQCIRPPGSLTETEFLARCIKCGQCMRICPTHIIQPATSEGGLEGFWTPVLNFRMGSSGCQLNCVACGHVCPTAAIRPLSLQEKLGRERFAAEGPVRMGTAFVDRGRCLPWAMDRPCIVCQENCPVSPKAIFVREEFVTVAIGALRVQRRQGETLELEGAAIPLRAGQFATGDYFLKPVGEEVRRLIVEQAERSLAVVPGELWKGTLPEGAPLEIQVRLQRPYVNPERCIGCGVCEHECPVSGKRAIRITAENESRNRKHSLLPG